jgi:hypothetical protein
METLFDITQDYEHYVRENPDTLISKFLLCVKLQVWGLMAGAFLLDFM